MRRWLGSIGFIGLLGLAQADEFSLNFSSDIVNSAQSIGNELDALPLTTPEKQDNGLLPLLPESKAEEQALKHSDAEKKAGKTVFRSSPRDAIRQAAKGRTLSAEESEFAPIQKVPADSFFAQYANDVEPFDSDKQAPSLADAGNDMFKQINEDLRTTVGEDMYAKMVWAYRDVKELDNWIYATIDQSGLFAQGSFLMNLNEQLFAGLTTTDEARGNLEASENSFNDWQKGLQTQQAREVKSVLDKEALRANMENQSVFYIYLQYLTPLNFIYFTLVIAALFYGGRFFRFMLSQQ